MFTWVKDAQLSQFTFCSSTDRGKLNNFTFVLLPVHFLFFYLQNLVENGTKCFDGIYKEHLASDASREFLSMLLNSKNYQTAMSGDHAERLVPTCQKVYIAEVMHLLLHSFVLTFCPLFFSWCKVLRSLSQRQPQALGYPNMKRQFLVKKNFKN